MANESYASIFIVGCMIVGSIGVTFAVVMMLIFGIRRAALASIGDPKAKPNRCPNPDCTAANPLPALFCRRCGMTLNRNSEFEIKSGTAHFSGPAPLSEKNVSAAESNHPKEVMVA
ncbi:MAG: hypothetical protein QM754_12345 [Tepidisphaeraceae bacterium]